MSIRVRIAHSLLGRRALRDAPSVPPGNDRVEPVGSSRSAGAGVRLAVASRLLGRMLGLVFIIYLARVEDAATFAAYSYLLVLAATLAALADAGIGPVTGREVARGTADLATTYRAGLPVAVGSAIIAALAVQLIGAIDRGPGTEGAALAWAGLFAAANLVFGFQAEMLRTSGRQGLEAVLQVAAGVLQFGLGVIVLSADGGLALLMAVLATKEIAVVAASQMALPLPWRGHVRIGWRRQLFLMGIWVSLASTALAVILRITQVTLSNAAEVRHIADYALAGRVLDVTFLLTWTVGIGLFPWMAERVHQPGDFRLAFLRLVGKGALIALTLSLLVLPLVPPAFDIIFDGTYKGAVAPAMLLLSSPVLLTVLFISWNSLIALGQERRLAIGVLMSALFTTLASGLIFVAPTAVVTACTTLLGILTMTVTVTALAMHALAARRPVEVS